MPVKHYSADSFLFGTCQSHLVPAFRLLYAYHRKTEVLNGLVASKFDMLSQAVMSVWVQLLQMIMLKSCPIITQAVEWDAKHQQPV